MKRLSKILLLIMMSLALWVEAAPEFVQYQAPTNILTAKKLLARADSLYLKANFNDAIDLTNLVLNYYEATNNITGQITCLNLLGDFFRGSDNFFLSRVYLNLAMKLATANHDSVGLVTAENVLSAVLYEQGPAKFDSSILLAEQSLQYTRRHHLEKLTYLNLNILGMIASFHGNNHYALTLLEEAYSILGRINPKDKPLVLNNMARIFFCMGQYKKAEQYGLKAYNLAKQEEVVWYIIMSAQFLGDLYHKTNRDWIGYPIQQDLINQLIKFYHEATEIRIKEVIARKLMTHKEKENTILKLNQELLSHQSNQRLLLQVVFIALFFLSLLLIINLLYQKQRVSKMNQALKELNSDIRQEKERVEIVADNLEISNATLQKFISIIAHDLRNPINTILGFTDLLNNDKDCLNEEEKRKALLYSNQAAIGANQLLEQLLEWARLQAGIIKPDPRRFILENICEEVLNVIHPSAMLKQQEIVCDIPADIQVFADRNMMLTLFRNLLSNAVKFTPVNGKIIITSKRESNKVVISFKDNGTGIPREKLKSLFRIDQQYKTKGTEGETGTGIGLLLCKEYVEKNKGTIQVKSELDKGSTFIVSLPV
ncbi:MAG: tetratricopeptide repeat-containing sensor histidine kinase [Bacteroidales bacterium]|nr:tetratricopeptide repeat-containing sensor histidine kinase [Bacteroidales bacterium]